MSEPLIYEISASGRRGVLLPDCDVPQEPLPAELIRADLDFPEVSELQVVRHFTRLSGQNYAIDKGFYPLGSCTMKYNPKINERTAGLSGFTNTHPLQPESTVKGFLEVYASCMDILRQITGFDEITMQPVAGAHGEMTCLMMIKAYHESRGEGEQRKFVLCPDSAHGTNPASAARRFLICGAATISRSSPAAASMHPTSTMPITRPSIA